jgi:hypothetical protein
MGERLNNVQIRWQSGALRVLLDGAGKHDRGPWIPAGDAAKAIRDETGCTQQAANGALKALLTVGLADRSETSEGHFWKATNAAERGHELFTASFQEELAAIDKRLVGIDQGLDQILWLQERREQIASSPQLTLRDFVDRFYPPPSDSARGEAA